MRCETYAVQVEDAGGRTDVVEGFTSIAHAEWWIEVSKRQAPRSAPPLKYLILERWDPSGLRQSDQAAA